MDIARQGAHATPRLIGVIPRGRVVPVVIMGLAAFVSFGITLLVLARAAVSAVMVPGRLASIVVDLVRVIDRVLIGVVMTVLAFGIHELLGAKVERSLPAAFTVRSRGTWSCASSRPWPW